MESIHPNDIITMDLSTISYLTLKNGNMVLIDDSVPEKEIKTIKKYPILIKMIQKFFKKITN